MPTLRPSSNPGAGLRGARTLRRPTELRSAVAMPLYLEHSDTTKTIATCSFDPVAIVWKPCFVILCFKEDSVGQLGCTNLTNRTLVNMSAAIGAIFAQRDQPFHHCAWTCGLREAFDSIIWGTWMSQPSRKQQLCQGTQWVSRLHEDFIVK